MLPIKLKWPEKRLKLANSADSGEKVQQTGNFKLIYKCLYELKVKNSLLILIVYPPNSLNSPSNYNFQV